MKKTLLTIGIVVAVLIAPIGFLFCRANYFHWKYMAPYRHLLEIRATKQQVIAQEGKYGFMGANKYWRTSEKALLYWADPYPWNPGEGYVVFIYFDKQGRVDEVFMDINDNIL